MDDFVKKGRLKSKATRNLWALRQRNLVTRAIREIIQSTEHKFSVQDYKHHFPKEKVWRGLWFDDLNLLERQRSLKNAADGGNSIAHHISAVLVRQDARLILQDNFQKLYTFGNIFEALYGTDAIAARQMDLEELEELLKSRRRSGST